MIERVVEFEGRSIKVTRDQGVDFVEIRPILKYLFAEKQPGYELRRMRKMYGIVSVRLPLLNFGYLDPWLESFTNRSK